MPLARQETLEDEQVYVFDAELGDETAKRLFHEFSRERLYSRSEAATSRSLEYKHWVTELDVGEFADSEAGQRTLQLVEKYYPGEAQTAFRAYCNLNSHGDALGVHRDCPPSDRDVTALWFLCEDWELDWRGELVLYDGKGDARVAVSPRPGRLCLFRGSLLHAGSPPSRLCPAPRLTLACKLAPEVAERAAPTDDGGAFATVPQVFEHIRARVAGLGTRDFEASYRFVVDGPGGGMWRIELQRDGGRVTVDDRAADLSVALHAQTLLDVLNGRVAVAREFVTGKIQVTGNLDLAMHLRDVLGPPGGPAEAAR
ncbi:MAG: 2OG-Fe(II) oxygenase [Planctomycetota bacterium]